MKLPPELVLAAFAASGGALKTADFLGERDGRGRAILAAAAAALLFGVLMTESAVSASIILGLLLGVTATKKVDRPNLVVGLILTVVVALILGIQPPQLRLVVVVAVIAAIDEWGHDARAGTTGGVALFFRHRCALKLAMSLLAVLGEIPILYMMDFLAFDVAYDLIHRVLEKMGADDARSTA